MKKRRILEFDPKFLDFKLMKQIGENIHNEMAQHMNFALVQQNE